MGWGRRPTQAPGSSQTPKRGGRSRRPDAKNAARAAVARAAAYAAPEQTACGIAHVEVLRFGPPAAAGTALELEDAAGRQTARVQAVPVRDHSQHTRARQQQDAWPPGTVTAHSQPAAGEEKFHK